MGVRKNPINFTDGLWSNYEIVTSDTQHIGHITTYSNISLINPEYIVGEPLSSLDFHSSFGGTRRNKKRTRRHKNNKKRGNRTHNNRRYP